MGNIILFTKLTAGFSLNFFNVLFLKQSRRLQTHDKVVVLTVLRFFKRKICTISNTNFVDLHGSSSCLMSLVPQ
jgi:hypothetical protein